MSWLGGKLLVSVLLLLLIGTAVGELPGKGTDSAITVHIVPHSHCDVGWQKTPEGYYEDNVQHILDNITNALTEDASRRFIWVEVYFLRRWFDNRTEDIRQKFLNLVKNGQVELVLGGIVMHDEACVYLDDAVHQMADGHIWLQEHITSAESQLPKYAWHIDPFGSSSLSPVMWKWIGFDGFVINRISCEVKDAFGEEKKLDMEYNELFTHVLDHHYSSPPGCDWEGNSTLNSIVTQENIKKLSDDLVATLKKRMLLFKGNDLLVPFGDDFRFQHAELMFTNMEKLIEYINAKSDTYGVRLQYSTLSDAMGAIETGIGDSNLPKYDGDFFPYDSNPQIWWTGYFTSWPQLKGFIRSRSSILRLSELLSAVSREKALSSGTGSFPETIGKLRDAVDVAQHHDAITGTSPPVGRLGYMDMLQEGTDAVTKSFLPNAMNSVTLADSMYLNMSRLCEDLVECLQSDCGIVLSLYNTLGWRVKQPVRIECAAFTTNPKLSSAYVHEFVQEKGQFSFKSVEADFFKLSGELVFYPSLPQLGHQMFLVTAANISGDSSNRPQEPEETGEPPEQPQESGLGDQIWENDAYRIHISDTNRITRLDVLDPDTLDVVWGVPLTIDFLSYASGNYENPYVFNASGPAQYVIPQSQKVDLEIHNGHSVVDIIQRYTSWIELRTSLYIGGDNVSGRYIEMNVNIGPLPDLGQDVVMQIHTDLENGRRVYSDEYGHSFRIREPNATRTEPGQYYPMVSKAYILDPQMGGRLEVSSDKSHGVASLGNGNMEIMLGRRDNFSTNNIAWIDDLTNNNHRFFVALTKGQNDELSRRSHVIGHRPMLFAKKLEKARFGTYFVKHEVSSSNLNEQMPADVHLVSLRRRSDRDPRYELRIVNLNDDIRKSVDLTRFSRHLQIHSIQETDLTTTKPKTVEYVLSDHKNEFSNVVLEPLELRTYLVKFKWQAHPEHSLLDIWFNIPILIRGSIMLSIVAVLLVTTFGSSILMLSYKVASYFHIIQRTVAKFKNGENGGQVTEYSQL